MINCLENGPYLIELKDGTKVALCRCGQSDKKPFCDGQHRAIKFVAQGRQIDERGQLQEPIES
jgi:CDGSH-type Zn-finger protein